MRRIIIPFAALVVFCIISASCNSYTCPAYANDAVQPEQQVEVDS